MTMEPQKIEQYVRCLLESWAVHDDGDEQGVYRTLYHLLMAVCRYELMSADERVLATALTKKMQYFFETKFSLKERKRKTTKEKFPLKPLLKEKEKKEIEEKTHTHVCDAKETFRQECLALVDRNNKQLVANFYNYWSEEDDNGVMLFERERKRRGWNTKKRLARWMNNQHTVADKAAAIRLKKAQCTAQADTAQQRAMTAQREDANARLEKEIADRKAGAVSREEWEAMKKQREKGG